AVARVHLGGATAGQTGAGLRAGTGTFAMGLLGGRVLGFGLRLSRGRLGGEAILLAEHFLFGGAFEQGDELLGVDRLPRKQDVGDAVELIAIVLKDVLGRLVGALDDAADLVVD